MHTVCRTPSPSVLALQAFQWLILNLWLWSLGSRIINGLPLVGNLILRVCSFRFLWILIQHFLVLCLSFFLRSIVGRGSTLCCFCVSCLCILPRAELTMCFNSDWNHLETIGEYILNNTNQTTRTSKRILIKTPQFGLNRCRIEWVSWYNLFGYDCNFAVRELCAHPP